MPQSHTTKQTSHKRFTERGKTGRVAASTPVRNSSKLNSIQGLYRAFIGGGTLSVRFSRVEMGGISCPEIGFFAL